MSLPNKLSRLIEVAKCLKPERQTGKHFVSCAAFTLLANLFCV